jgi:hypothetical protein
VNIPCQFLVPGRAFAHPSDIPCDKLAGKEEGRRSRQCLAAPHRHGMRAPSPSQIPPPPPLLSSPSQQPGGNAGGRAEWQNGAKCMQISLILRYFWARYHDDIFHKSGSRSCIGPPSPRAPWVFLRRCCRSLAGLGSAVQHG